MRTLIVRPRDRTVEIVYAKEPHEVYQRAGLDRMGVDHGVIAPGIGYVVYEYSLFEPTDKQSYWALGRTLVAGNTVLYGFGKGGDTVDCPDVTPRWFANANEVEAAIRAGEINRPVMKVNDVLIWQWPERKPRSEP